ncbi:MAG TPA: GntR family transcriptional regulator, partial [Kribbella sp.]
MKQTSGPRLSSRLYEELRRGVITGVYSQGQRLTEQSLAAELGVSRIPLREALPQLEVEGF